MNKVVAIKTTPGKNDTVELTIGVKLTWDYKDPEQVERMQQMVQDILRHASDAERARLSRDLNNAFERFNRKRVV